MISSSQIQNMKIYILILITLLSFAPVLSQTQPERYFNSQYNFSFIPPAGSKFDKSINDETKSITTYSYFTGSKGASFSLTFALPAPVSTNIRATALFKGSTFLEDTEKQVFAAFAPSMHLKVLSKGYVDYYGRPAARFDYTLEHSEGLITTGTYIFVFVVEKQIIVGFNVLAESSIARAWGNRVDAAIRSISISSKAK
jgi:hypothetical protein